MPRFIVISLVMLMPASVLGQSKTGDVALKVYEVGKDVLVIAGKLTKDDPPLAGAPIAALNGAPHQLFHVKLQKGQSYVIDLVSKDFEAYLILQNAIGKVLAHDDDSGGGQSSRIVITVPADGVYRVVAAALDGKPGVFELKIRGGEFADEQKLAALATKLNGEGMRLYRQGKAAASVEKMRQALDIRQKLFPAAKYPDGHPELATSLNSMGFVLQAMGQAEQALAYCRQSLAMNQKLFPTAKYSNGHPDLARSLNNLGGMLQEMGQTEQALGYYRQGLAMNQKLFPAAHYPDGHPNLAGSLNNQGFVLRAMGQAEQALGYFRQSLEMRQKLFSATKFPNGHLDLAISLNNLGSVLLAMGQAEEAVGYYRQSLEMMQKLFPASKYADGHPDLALSLNSMGFVLQAMGQAEQALGYFRQSLEMRQKLFPAAKYPDGHRDLARSLNNLGFIMGSMVQTEQALGYYRQSLEMRQKLFPAAKYPIGHPELAQSLNSMGFVLQAMDQAEGSVGYYRQSLEMRQKLFPAAKYPDGHPDLATSLNNLGFIMRAMGQTEQALGYYRQSLEMRQKLFPAAKYPDGHPDLAQSLNNLGFVLQAMGQTEQAHGYYRQGLEMQQRQLRRELATASEEAAFDKISAELLHRDAYLTVTGTLKTDGGPSFAMIWPSRSMVTRLLEQRQANARAAGSAAGAKLDDLRGCRRRVEQLLQDTRRKVEERDKLLAEYADKIDKLQRELIAEIPAQKLWQELDKLGPADLVKALPPGAVFIDILRYTRFDYVQKKQKRTPSYVAFVLQRKRLGTAENAEGAEKSIERIELEDAAPIDAAVRRWRSAIDSRRDDPKAVAELQRLVWEKLAKALPAGTKTLYLAADSDLARLPWAALPLPPSPGTPGEGTGVRAGRVLLEDYAIAQVPHGLFLLDHLLHPRNYAGPESLLALGGVEYNSPEWPALPGTLVESKAVQALASQKPGFFEKPGFLTGQDATADRLSKLLPTVRYAHLATHGEFKAAELTKEKKRAEKVMESRLLGDDTRKIAPKNPLGYVGLVLSEGKNITGLSLVDLPLENLKLVTLSACETGLGEYTGGEGVQGLQRAFHLAGCPNVVASLWKVNDAATAALMAKFYHEMWVNKKPPIEALREAQLTIYRHPELIPDLAGERGAPRLKEAIAVRAGVEVTSTGKHADTKLWAAFVLSGVGK